MKIAVITLFPEMFNGVLNTSMLWKAQDKGLVEFRVINLRDHGLGPRHQVDDTPYGGGDGMLLKPEPIAAALTDAKTWAPDARTFIMTPKGQTWKQAFADELSRGGDLIFICGHYEGFDERIFTLVDGAVSVGDYVLTGGELPAMTVIDSVVRLIPGVLGGATSTAIESFADGETLEYPQYTRPEVWNDLSVPEVLLSGNHAAIAAWRAAHAPKKQN
jgi:tRNA (guanine37-N1)-methyltransferase